MRDQNPAGETSDWYDTVDCSTLFRNVNMGYSHLASSAIEGGYCVDPDLAYVKGLQIYGKQKYLEIKF